MLIVVTGAVCTDSA